MYSSNLKVTYLFLQREKRDIFPLYITSRVTQNINLEGASIFHTIMVQILIGSHMDSILSMNPQSEYSYMQYNSSDLF